MDNAQKVLKAMKSAGKPLKSGEVAELAGIDQKETGKIIKKLQEEGKITSPKRCFYQPA